MHVFFEFIKNLFSTWGSKERISEILSWIGFILLYGLVLNYIALIFLNSRIGFETVPAYGLGWYFIRYELTRLVHMIRS